MDIGKTITRLKEGFETALTKEFAKTSLIRVGQLMLVFLGISLALSLIQSIVNKDLSVMENLNAYLGLAFVGAFFAISFWIAAFVLGERKFSFLKAIHSQVLFVLFALIAGLAIGILVWVLLLIPTIGVILAALLGLVQAIGGLFLVFALLKGATGTYGKAVKIWGVGQVIQIVVVIGLFLLYMNFSPDMTKVPSYYTAETIQNADGTLLILNYTREGIKSEYCTVQLGREWTMLEPDAKRDGFYVDGNIHSNETRRFVNSYGDELSFWGVFRQGGDYRQCGSVRVFLINNSVSCYDGIYKNQRYIIDGTYVDQNHLEIDFKVNSTSNNTRFLPVINTTSCTSVWISNSWYDRIYPW